MGLTREQKQARYNEQCRKRAEYNRIMTPIWAEQARQEAERIKALGMLLNANWSGSKDCFIKKVEAEGAPGGYILEFYDRGGKYTGNDQDG